jgi:hypothetical protein
MAMLLRDMATRFQPRLNHPLSAIHISKNCPHFNRAAEKILFPGKQKKTIFEFFHHHLPINS